jgi:predicted TIM-barrel fold metal-dependent hydrolase
MRTLLERNESIFLAVDANPRIDLTPEVSAFLNSEMGRQRCLWGSNGCCWNTALAKLDALPLDAETRQLFSRENAIRVFGLEKQDRPQFEVEFVLTGE